MTSRPKAKKKNNDDDRFKYATILGQGMLIITWSSYIIYHSIY